MLLREDSSLDVSYGGATCGKPVLNHQRCILTFGYSERLGAGDQFVHYRFG